MRPHDGLANFSRVGFGALFGAVNTETANIILLLISADFLASDYCYDREMRRALNATKLAKRA